jgi:hypothetical protein
MCGGRRLHLIPVSAELFATMTEMAKRATLLFLQVAGRQVKSLSCDEAFLHVTATPHSDHGGHGRPVDEAGARGSGDERPGYSRSASVSGGGVTRTDRSGSTPSSDGRGRSDITSRRVAVAKDPALVAAALRAAVTRVTGGLTVSIGVGHSMVAARFATTRAKPPGPGVCVIEQQVCASDTLYATCSHLHSPRLCHCHSFPSSQNQFPRGSVARKCDNAALFSVHSYAMPVFMHWLITASKTQH